MIMSCIFENEEKLPLTQYEFFQHFLESIQVGKTP